MSEEEDDITTLSSISDGEDELKDVELMKDILQSIEQLRALPEASDSAVEECVEEVSQVPVDLDSLALMELNVILDQISQAREYNNSLQSALLMKELKLLSIKRQLEANRFQHPGMKDAKYDEAKGDIGKYIVRFKAPYFKDHRTFASYRIVPEKELPFSAAKYHDRALQWTKTDLKELEYGIKNFLSRRSFQDMMKNNPATLREKEHILSRYAHLRKADLNKLVTDDFDNIIDWCNIASRLKKIHSPSECQKAWEIFLKPSINKKKWNKKELEQLKACALQRNYEDWDAIAKDLGTNRSGYQCFHEYLGALMKVQEGEWSKTEEEFLIKLVKGCTYGERILWHKVSYFFETRSLAQIYRKWKLSAVGKNNRAGHFTEEEDQIIIDSLIMTSGDVNRVARSLNRLGSQIRYRCAQLKNSLQHRYGEWTLEEDQQLMDLVKKYGFKKWAQVAEHIPSRGRVQCRHRYNHLRKKMAADPEKKLNELCRPKRPTYKNRKQVNIKYLLDKTKRPKTGRKSRKADTAVENDDPDDPGEKDDAVIGFDTPFGPLVLRKDDVEGVVVKKGKYRDRRKQVLTPKAAHQVVFNDDIVVTENVEGSGDFKYKKNRRKGTTTKLAADLSPTILNYYSSISEYIGDPVKPSDVCDSELEMEITNALLKFRPYKYFNTENADWWYSGDRSDPYYKEVFSYVERKEKDDREMKEGADWLLPPCTTSFEGFYNLLVDVGYKPSDLDKSEEEIEEELNELYCASDEETIGAVARWKQRLKTLFLWPAALSEIELDKNEGEAVFEEAPGCSQVLNESEIIQLAEELNQIEDDDLRAVMVRQLGLVEGSNANKANTERLSILVLQDDSEVLIKNEIHEFPETAGETNDVTHEEIDSAQAEIVENDLSSSAKV